MSRRREPPPLIPSGMFRAGEPIGRRTFVQTAGGILVATSGLQGCAEKLPAGTQSGTLAVRVIGLATAPAPANGGTVVVTVTAGGQTATFPGTVPANGFASGDVPVGNYTITYTPPSGYLLATGEVGTKTAQVTATQSAEVDFNVVAAAVPTGTLTVKVTGLSASATTGGSASVLRTDISGQTPQVSQVPANGTLNLSVAAGTYSVTYTVPAGYTLNAGVNDPQTGLVVPANGSVSATFAVTAAAGGTAPNIYAWGFENNVNNFSGAFVNGSIQPFLGNTAWQLVTTGGALGSNCVKQLYPVSAGNVGQEFYYPFASPRTQYYVRWAYKQDLNFNNNNADGVKVLRGLGPGLNSQLLHLGIENNGTGAYIMDWGGVIDSQAIHYNANVNLPAPTANQLIGSWHWFEVMFDITTSGALKMQCWIDDVLYFDYTSTLSNNGQTVQYVQFDGTVNSMQVASTAYFDEIGLSSQKMGIPTQPS